MSSPEPIRRVLVGVDTRGLARDAVVRALDLSRRLGAVLDLLHVVEAPLPRGPVARKEELAQLNDEHVARERVQAERIVADACAAAGVDGSAHAAEVETVPGRAAEALVRRAEATGADLVVIGPHGERGLFDFGSTTRALIGHLKVPVWNQQGSAEPIERVLVPIDFSDHSRAAVRVAVGLARAFDAPLALLHCYVPPSYAYDPDLETMAGSNYVVDADRENEREELQRWIAELDLPDPRRVGAVFCEGDPRVAVADATEPGDLVVMGTQGRTGFSRFLLGSVAYAVVKASQGQVVVVPDPEDG